MIDNDVFGAVGGMRTGRVNLSTQKKPAPVPLPPPQILHDLIWTCTRAAAVGSLTGVFFIATAVRTPNPTYINETSGSIKAEEF
jgi:hypothetical protein